MLKRKSFYSFATSGTLQSVDIAIDKFQWRAKSMAAGFPSDWLCSSFFLFPAVGARRGARQGIC